MFAKNTLAAALLTLAPVVSAAIGDAIIENNCGFPVYLWSVSNVAGPEVIIPAGSNHTEQYYSNPNGGGISIKMAANAAAATVTQFEYTLDGTSLWYDVSNINGYPFEQWGLTLVPSDATCPSVTCDAGVAQCKDVYNQSNDDAATHWCTSAANMVMVLCSGNVAAASSIASSAATAATTTSTKTTTTKAAATTKTTTAAATTTTTVTTPKAAAATTATPSSSAPAVTVTTTFVTVQITQSGTTSTITSSLDTPVAATSTTTSTTTTDDRVFHGHTFAWPSFTGFPGAKVRRGHQHFHAHAHGMHA